MRANEAVQRVRRGCGRPVDPGTLRARRRYKHGKHLEHVLALGVSPAHGDHQGRPRPRRKYGRGSVCRRDRPEELDVDRVTRGLGNLIDHHGHRTSAGEGSERA